MVAFRATGIKKLAFISVILFYTIAWSVALSAWFPRFSTHLAGDAGGDGSLTAWQLLWPYEFLRAWFTGSGPAGIAAYLNGGQFAGLAHGGAYAFSDMMPGWLPVVAFLRLWTDNVVLIVNTIHGSSLVLLSPGVYFLSLTFRAGRGEALAAGILGSFSAYHFDMLLHLQMQFAFAPVFALYFQRRTFASNGVRLLPLAGWWFGLGWTLLVSPHLFLFGVVASGALLIGTVGDRALMRRGFLGLVADRRRLAVFVLLGLATLALLLVGSLPYLYYGRLYGFERLKAEAYYSGLRLEHFAYAPERLLGDSSVPDGGPHEKNARIHPLAVWLFLIPFFRLIRRGRGRGVWRRAAIAAAGATLLFWVATLPARAGPLAVAAADVLILGALIAGGRALWLRAKILLHAGRLARGGRVRGSGRARLALPIVLAFLFLLAAFGPRPVFHNLELPYIAPYNLLYEFVPGFDRIRAASRIFVFFWVFFGIVAAGGLRMTYVTLAAGLRRRRFVRVARPLALGVSIGLLCLIWYDAVPASWKPEGDVAAYASLRRVTQESGADAGPVLVFADDEKPERWDAALLPHALKSSGTELAGGYSGVRVDPYVWLQAALRDFYRGRNGWTETRIRILLRRAGVGRLWRREADGFVDASALLSGSNRTAAPECDSSLGGRWRFSERMSSRQALLLGFRPEGPFCVGPYGRFRDRGLRLIWNGPREFQSRIRVSTPPYYHPGAFELLYAAPGPGRRGRYEVVLFEGTRELHRQPVYVH